MVLKPSFVLTAVAPQEWQGTESGLQLYYDLQTQIPCTLQVSFIIICTLVLSVMHRYLGYKQKYEKER